MKTIELCDYCNQPLTKEDLALGFYDANSKKPVCENCSDYAEPVEEPTRGLKDEK